LKYKNGLNMKRVIYPGTFDPVTNGHIDIVRRASELFDEVVVTIAKNPGKTCMFSINERIEMLEESLKEFPNVLVDSFDGLVVDHAKQVGAIGIVRGLRAVSDFEYEFQMALMNRKLAGEISTILLMPHARYTYLNSTIIRNLAAFGGDVAEFVPLIVQNKLKERFISKKNPS